MRIAYRGHELLRHPKYNKGTAFTQPERIALDLTGLLPAHVSTIEEQVRRVYANMARKSDDLERYIGLLALHERNERLFYRVIHDHLEELLPIVYTPTVGLACQRHSAIFRHPRGLWITPEHRGSIERVLATTASRKIRLIVATDNERILGLGDLGAGGMGIPVGKLMLYTVAGGIDPDQVLPISLDVGTDNTELLNDDLYLGWPHRRLRGEPYFSFVDEFVQAVIKLFPDVLLQWEDFKRQNAFTLLDCYRQALPSFNDDIQGTAAVVVAAMLSAVRATDIPIGRQRVIVLGAGGAGIGIARQLLEVFKRHGRSGDDLRGAVAVLDSGGLLHNGRKLQELTKQEVAWPVELARASGLDVTSPLNLSAVVRALKPTMLVGASGQAGAFSEEIIRVMAKHVRRPVVLPLSNPTSMSEARPADLIGWTQGRAIVAAGSPFEPVSWEGKKYKIGQANNIYVFPGIGLGTLLAKASVITDAMFAAAAEALAGEVSTEEIGRGVLFPEMKNLRAISARVAYRVMQQARMDGVSRACKLEQVTDSFVAEQMWQLDYPVYEPG